MEQYDPPSQSVWAQQSFLQYPHDCCWPLPLVQEPSSAQYAPLPQCASFPFRSSHRSSSDDRDRRRSASRFCATKSRNSSRECVSTYFLALVSFYQPTEREIIQQLRDPSIHKITIVKHPLARLHSAFKSKFYGISKSDVSTFYRLYGVRLPIGADFDTFLRELSKIPLHAREAHFMPTSILCSYYVEKRFQHFVDLGISPRGLDSYLEYNEPFAGRPNLYKSLLQDKLEWQSVLEVILSYSADAAHLDDDTRRHWSEIDSQILQGSN